MIIILSKDKIKEKLTEKCKKKVLATLHLQDIFRSIVPWCLPGASTVNVLLSLFPKTRKTPKKIQYQIRLINFKVRGAGSGEAAVSSPEPIVR